MPTAEEGKLEDIERLKRLYRERRAWRRNSNGHEETEPSQAEATERLEEENPYYSPQEVRGEWQTMSK